MRTVYHMLLLVLLPTAFMQAEHRSVDLIRAGGIVENNMVREGCMREMTLPIRQLVEKDRKRLRLYSSPP